MILQRTACPLNCPDSCSLIVDHSNGRIKVQGDKESITQGFICSKGRALAERVFSPERLKFPLLKKDGWFQRVSWDEAYTIFVEKIKETLKTTGPWGIFHHYDYSHNGVLKGLDRRFFQALGGVTEPRGSMCWGAGFRAQMIDFGDVLTNDWSDITNSKLIILWGRDPAITQMHLLPNLIKAKEKGAEIIVINPVQVKSADFATDYIRVNPGSDGFLALSLAHIIMREGWVDWDFIRNYVYGLEEYALKAKEYAPEEVATITGVSLEKQEELARKISHHRPVAILPGYGMQRYVGGGNTMRAIDALAAITGNIGKKGAGVFYANQYHHKVLRSLNLEEDRYNSRTFPHPILAEEVKKADPPINLAVVTRSNPLVQQPNSILWREVWREIPFKVTFDIIMSETARHSDLVLPVTTAFEEEDLIATSWSNMLQLTQKIVEPQGEAKTEVEIFTDLAKCLNLEKDFPYTHQQWLEYIIKPLEEYGITLEKLRQGPIPAPYIPKVAFSDYQFNTPSGKIELASDVAFNEYGDKVANPTLPTEEEDYPWHLITPHPKNSIHSQFFEEEGFTMFIHPELAEKFYLMTGDKAIIETEHGQLIARVAVSEDIHPQTVVIPEGSTDDGWGVNKLIGGKCSDYGENTAYYETRCLIRKWLVD